MNCNQINGKNWATLLMDGPKYKGKTLSDSYCLFLYYSLQTYFIILFYFQARIRGLQARLRHQNLVRNAKAKIIQTNLRGWLAQKQYQICLHIDFDNFSGKPLPHKLVWIILVLAFLTIVW